MRMKSPTSYFLIFSFLNPLSFHNTFSVFAGEYQAECDEQSKQEHFKKHPPLNMALKQNKGKKIKKCFMNIDISSSKISNKYTTIPTTRVTSWSVTGESRTDTGGKVVATVAFGLIGLLASNPKKHDYDLLINGYDLEGDKTFIKMKFKDGKQPQKIMSELSMITGLGMGQIRSLEEIKDIELNVSEINPDNLDPMINSLEPENLY